MGSVNADCCVPRSMVVPSFNSEAECHGICLQSMLLGRLRQENHLNLDVPEQPVRNQAMSEIIMQGCLSLMPLPAQ